MMFCAGCGMRMVTGHTRMAHHCVPPPALMVIRREEVAPGVALLLLSDGTVRWETA